jgi:hypothetical protein
MNKVDPWELLRKARKFVGFCPLTQEGMDTIASVRNHIDTALAEHDKEQ